MSDVIHIAQTDDGKVIVTYLFEKEEFAELQAEVEAKLLKLEEKQSITPETD